MFGETQTNSPSPAQRLSKGMRLKSNFLSIIKYLKQGPNNEYNRESDPASLAFA